jgi:RNA polymerase sigma-70 factor (ECF subfamily)
MARGAGDLADWLDEGYAPAFRTACLILHNRADAEEAVQEAFLRAWRFRAAVPVGEGVQPWLYRVVVNACLSKLRSETRHRTDSTQTAELIETGPGPEGLAVDGVTHRTVVSALADLPEHLRVVVALRYYAGLSEREIAAAIHRRPGTVKSRLHEAKSRLGADPRLVALRPDTTEADGSPS